MTQTHLIDFGLGFGSIILLMQVTSLVYMLAKKYKAVFAIAGGMMVLDLMALLSWMGILKPFADNEELFVGGMGLAIFMGMIHKVKKLHTLTDE